MRLRTGRWCAALCVLCICRGTRASEWEAVHKTTSKIWGGENRHSIRYSHCSSVYHDQLVISHGYFYNTEVKGPQWLSDTWTMSLHSPYAMHEIHSAYLLAAAARLCCWLSFVISANVPAEGVSDTAAAALYKKKKTPPVPSGRYGAACVTYKDKLWMYAGSDGGYSKHGNGGYELGYEMDELYALDLKSLTWECIVPKGSRPAARYLHTAVVITDAMVVFGGSDSALGDVWSFSFESRRWTQLSKAVPRAKGGPESLYAHSAVPTADDSGFIVFGGQYVTEHALSNDVWYFNTDKRKWHNILASGSRPAPRFFHEMAAVPVHSLAGPVSHNISKLGDQVTVAVFTGGSTRSPLLRCTAETWLMAINPHTKEQVWQRLPDLPYGFYYHKVDVHGNFAYVTGGHLCSETKSNKPNYYLNHVLRLDLTLWLHDHKTSSSKSYPTELRRANLSR